VYATVWTAPFQADSMLEPESTDLELVLMSEAEA
jgi:hypothetical protein